MHVRVITPLPELRVSQAKFSGVVGWLAGLAEHRAAGSIGRRVVINPPSAAGDEAEAVLTELQPSVVTSQRSSDWSVPEKQPVNHQKGSYARLEQILACISTQVCRRKPLLTYFGEDCDSYSCEMCDNCVQTEQAGILEPTAVILDEAPVDLSAPTCLRLACVREVNQRFGMDQIIKILRGSRSKKGLGFKHDQLAAYGTGSMYNGRERRGLVVQFIALGLVAQNAYGALDSTGKGHAVLKGERVLGRAISSQLSGRLRVDEQAYARELFEKLRDLRGQLTRERGLPPYVIFHDWTLIDMSTYLPDSSDAFAMRTGGGGCKVGAVFRNAATKQVLLQNQAQK